MVTAAVSLKHTEHLSPGDAGELMLCVHFDAKNKFLPLPAPPACSHQAYICRIDQSGSLVNCPERLRKPVTHSLFPGEGDFSEPRSSLLVLCNVSLEDGICRENEALLPFFVWLVSEDFLFHCVAKVS